MTWGQAAPLLPGFYINTYSQVCGYTELLLPLMDTRDWT